MSIECLLFNNMIIPDTITNIKKQSAKLSYMNKITDYFLVFLCRNTSKAIDCSK
jgi:hypothetical protein